jgi:hypothetical protein
MKTSILDQFASDAINAPETVTGGSGRRTHRRTHRRTRGDNSGSISLDRRTHRRTRTHRQ